MTLKEVSWSKQIPSEVRNILIPILRKWVVLVPAWCRDFRVGYAPDQVSTIADMTSNYRNRWACLRLSGRWLSETTYEREAVIIHELIHINLEPIDEAVGRALEALPNDEMRDLCRAFYTDGVEAATEDLAWAFLRIVK